MPVADGGEGTVDALCSEFEQVETVDAFGRPRIARTGVLADGTRVVEAAEAIPLDPSRLDVIAASSRGLGLWIAQYRDCPLVVTVGGTATMDAGAGLLEVLDRLPGPTRVLCDVATTLYDAPRLFGPQKGATSEQVVELEARFRADRPAGSLRRICPAPGRPAGSALRSRRWGRSSCRARTRSSTCSVSIRCPTTSSSPGEGTVDATTWEGKAPAAVAPSLRRRGRPLRRLRRTCPAGTVPRATVDAGAGRAQRRPGSRPTRISSSSGRSWGARLAVSASA